MDPKNMLDGVSNATSGSNALKIDPTNANTTSISSTAPNNVINFPGNDNPIQSEGNTDNIVDFPSDEDNADNIVAFPTDNNNNSNENMVDAQPGDKVESGKKINENGEVEDSSTKKTLKAVGRGVGAYVSGGSSIGKDQAIANSKPVDKTIGVVADTIDKVPGAEQVTQALDDAGVADGVNDALDLVGNAKNGDIKGTIDSAKKLSKDTKKAKKFVKKKALVVVAAISIPLLFFLIIFVVVLGPVLGGFMDIVEGITDTVGGAFDAAGDFLFGENEANTAIDMVTEIPEYTNLSGSRQRVLSAAASAVAANIPYKYSSHANNVGIEGIPAVGLDCSAFVEWAIWTGTGNRPGYLTTGEITRRIGQDFIEISKDELRPGDIGLKRRGSSTNDDYNHTGIYAGNGQWFHATGGKTRKVVRNNYKGFTIYLRYTGVD